jgi:hypothetical protein
VPDPRLAPYRLPSLAFAAYLVLLAVSAAVLFALKLGADADSVRAFYLGSEARFTSPRTLVGLLEVAVPHAVAIPLVLFAAVHVVGFARALPGRLHAALVAISFGSALAGILAGFAVRFAAPGLAWAKTGAFLLLEAALLAWAALLGAIFVPRRVAAEARAPRAAPAREGAR